jgi:hypothetical protein
MIPLVTASEVGKAQSELLFSKLWSVDSFECIYWLLICLENQVIEGENPVFAWYK